MSPNAWAICSPVSSKLDPEEAWLKIPGFADALSTPKEAVLEPQATEVHRELAILEELQDKALELQVKEVHQELATPEELQDAETQYSQEPDFPGAGGAAGHWPRHTGSGPTLTPQSTVFEMKYVFNTENEFDGDNSGEHWKGRTRNCFCGFIPAVKPLLEWAEGFCKVQIVQNDVKRLRPRTR